MKTPDPIIKQYLETPEGSIPDLRARSRIKALVVLVVIIALMATFISLAGLISGGIIMIVVLIGPPALVFALLYVLIAPWPSKADIIRDIAQYKRETEEQKQSTIVAIEPQSAHSAPDFPKPLESTQVVTASEESKPGRIFIRREEDATAFKSWYVNLDGKPIAKLASGATVIVPTTAVHHMLTFSESDGVPSGVQIGIAMPRAENTLYLIGVGTTGIALLESRVLSVTEANSLPAQLADVSGNIQLPRAFPFNEVLWRATTMLFIFYWLFRWLWPPLLPESLRQLSFQSSLIPCVILGLIWTGISFLMRIGGSAPKDNKLHNDDKSR